MEKVLLPSAVKTIIYREEDDKLGVLTEDGNFRILDNNLKTVAGFKTNLAQGHDFRQTQFISSDLKYVVLAKAGTNQASMLDVEKKKVLYTIGKNSGEIETLFINNSDRYLVSGGIDGRTYIYDLKVGHFLYNLPSHADYVTAITITNTAQLVATGSFDGVIYVTNLNILKNPTKLTGHQGNIIGIEFLNKGKLVSADKNGNILIFDFVNRKLKKRLEKVPDDITTIAVDPSREFLYVGTKLGKVLVYSIDEEKLLSDNLRKYSASVTDLAITKDGILYIGLQDGSIYQEKLIDDEKYNALFAQNDFYSLYAELEHSPFVVYSKAYQKMEQKWEESLISAKDLLSQKKNDEAKKILEPFINIPKKRSVVRTILSEFEEFSKFKYYVENKKYALAYPMLLKYNTFVDTKEYKSMEADWSRRFNKAQDIILDPKSDDQVKELLQDFRGIPAKTKQIQQLFKDRVVFNMFKKRLDSRNYKEIFNFLKQYPFLKELSVYTDLMKYADACYINMMTALANLDFLKVREYMDTLSDFEDFENDLKDIDTQMTLLIKLTQYCKSNDLVKIYEIIDNLDYEVELDCVKKLNRAWDHIVQKAEILSYKGDTKALLLLFKDYFVIESKNIVIKKILLSAYVKKLEYFMTKAGEDNLQTKAAIEKKIIEMHNVFGYIEEMRSIVFLYNSFYDEQFEIENPKPEQEVSEKEYVRFFG